MKVVILAGGRPSTITDEQGGIPKPMAEIGGRPLIWHIMKSFSSHGFQDFIVCGGYKVEMLKEYFLNYEYYESDITIDLGNGSVQVHNRPQEEWKVMVVNTGLNASTAQRVAQIENYIIEEDFIVTYGDCLSDIDILGLLDFHRKHKKLVTLAVAGTTGRNEALRMDDTGKLLEKASDVVSGAWTNACTYVLRKEVFSLLDNGVLHLEQQLMNKLVPLGEMVTYKHYGFWVPVETYRDRMRLEQMWSSGNVPWLG